MGKIGVGQGKGEWWEGRGDKSIGEPGDGLGGTERSGSDCTSH